MNGKAGNVSGGRKRRRVSGEAEDGAGPQGRSHPQRLGGY